MKNKGGFTIVEVLTVIVILSIMAAMGAATYTIWQKNVQVLNARDELQSTLVKAQQLAASAAQNSSWGVHLQEDAYVLFKGDFYNESDPNNELRNLATVQIQSPTSTFADGAGGYGSDVVFSKFVGTTHNTGTIQIIVPNNPSIFRTLIVNSTGKID